MHSHSLFRKLLFEKHHVRKDTLTIGGALKNCARQGRVIGGFPTPIERHPYQLSLLYLGRHVCGAVLISDGAALSAAHCILAPPQFHLVRCGGTFLNTDGVVKKIAKILKHPKYNKKTADYDLSVLFLEHPVGLGGKIRPVALPGGGEKILAGKTGVVTGWGHFLPVVPLSSHILRSAEVFLVDFDVCKKTYPPLAITDRMICAGTKNGERDACVGDSGGALVVDGKLFGVVSWGLSCGQGGYPGIYTNIIALRSFIKENTKI